MGWRARMLGAALAVAATVCAAPAQAATPLVRVTADTSLRGPVVPKSFLGFSMELQAIRREIGLGTLPNTALAAIFQQIAATGHGAPVLRIGGGSQDNGWYNPDGRAARPGLTQALDVPALVGVREFLRASGSKAVFGLNLAINDPQVPTELALAAEQIIGRDKLISFELGNEPDIYHVRGLYVQNGEVVHPRPATYTPAQHMSEFSAHREAILAAGVRTPLAGPAVGMSNVGWMRDLPTFVRGQRNGLGEVALHAYPLSGCTGGDRPLPHAGNLLENGLMAVNGKRMIDAVRLARRGGVHKVRITETNSATCGGIKGASDVMAGALWTLDWSFTMLFGGATGINYHASPAFYRPFSAGWHEGAWKVSPAPPLYAHLMFAEATPAGARLLPTTYFGAQPRKNANVKTWGTLSKDRRTIRVVVIYKAGRGSGQAVLRVPGAVGRATLKRLSAPTWSSTYEKVSYAGRQLPVLSTDGRLRGREVARRLRGSAKAKTRTFRFDMRPYTAALLTVRLAKPARKLG